MSKTNNDPENNQLESVGEAINQAEDFVTKYKSLLIGGAVAIFVIIGGYFGYTELISNPRKTEAATQMFKAEHYFTIDSFNVALNGNGNDLGFLEIIKEYGSTPSGNLAYFYAGVCQYELGEYNESIKSLNKFKSDDEFTAARALCLMGDSYVELNDLDSAIKHFLKAANKNDNNFAANYLFKASTVYESQGKYKEALALYEKVKNDYKKSEEAKKIDKYIERASILSQSSN